MTQNEYSLIIVIAFAALGLMTFLGWVFDVILDKLVNDDE